MRPHQTGGAAMSESTPHRRIECSVGPALRRHSAGYETMAHDRELRRAAGDAVQGADTGGERQRLAGQRGNDGRLRQPLPEAGHPRDGRLGSNPAEDAIYPLTFVDALRQPLNADHDYVLHFDANALPPVDAFWALTLYDTDGFQYPNPLNRCALGDRLQYNPDGSLDLLIRHEHPGTDREPNWLPAPRGPLALFLRLYAPRRSPGRTVAALTGQHGAVTPTRIYGQR